MRGQLAVRGPAQKIRAFYLPVYTTGTLSGSGTKSQLTAMIGGAYRVSHAILTVHLRAPTGNTVQRDGISEDPNLLPDWFDLVRSKGLIPALCIILFKGTGFGWAGFWNPPSPDMALTNYWNAIRPYVQQAQAANLPFVILCDEWSTLYAKAAAVDAFSNLFARARTVFGGDLALNVSNMEEADIKTDIATLGDFVGINAYVPLATVTRPTVSQMVDNLTGRSEVTAVKEMVDGWAAAWRDPKVVGYVSYLRHLALMWGRPILLTTGYKSTVGAALDPSGQPETTADNVSQSDCWDAFLQATATLTCMGYAAWRWWPSSVNDDGATGFTPQNKLAASTIGQKW